MFAFLIEALWHPRVVELLLFKSTETRIHDACFFIRKTGKTKRSKGREADEDMLIGPFRNI